MDEFSRSLAAAAIIDGQHFTLPTCGTLSGVYVPARVDHVARTVEPPTLEITWSKQPSDNAQTFADLLATSGATREEARITQQSWVEALQAGEAIAVGDLGVLQLDEPTSLIGFTPNKAGLRSAFWAGGPVHVEPIDRRQTNSTSASAAAKPSFAAPEPPIPRRPRKKKSSKLVPALAALGVLLVAAAVYVFGFRQNSPQIAQVEKSTAQQGKVVPVRVERINRSPRDPAEILYQESTKEQIRSQEESGLVAGQPDAQPQIESVEEMLPEPVEGLADEVSAPSDEMVDPGMAFDPASLAGAETSAPMPAAPVSSVEEPAGEDDLEVIIMLGSFGSAANAARLTERIAGEGLLPYVDQPNTLTRVGVTFSASSRAEIDEMLARLRRDYEPSAYVLER